MLTNCLAHDLIGCLCPHEGGGILIPVADIGLDVSDQRSHGVERAAADGLAREDAEPGLDHVEPGGAGRREVEVDAGMSLEPRLDLGGLVRGRVVENDMEFAPIVTGNLLEKTQEVTGGMTGAALPDDLATLEIQGGIETGESIAFVVVGLPGRQPFAQGKKRLRAIQGLDLGLLIETDDRCVIGGVQVEADHVADLLLGLGIGTELEGLDAVRFEAVLLPDPMNGAVREIGPIREFGA